ncbi:MAG: hypothetical protein PF447_06255 [Spirochaetaceae bacterium]|nr:hypothetical protein [Spirochaetaceae bacterium]
MGRIGKVIAVFLISFTALYAEQVRAEDMNLEPWLLLEKGKTFFRHRDYSTALNYFSYAQHQHSVFPEVEYWLGRVYQEEGEYLLAEEQYLKAYELKNYLYISDQQYDIAYELASMYLNRRQWDEYENMLLSLVNQEMGRDTSWIQQEHNLIRVLKEQGMDDLLYLYRRSFRYSQRALKELGVYYFKKENYRSATLFNLYSVLSQFSQVAQAILEVNPDYQFPRDLDQLILWDPSYVLSQLEMDIQRLDSGFLFSRQPHSEEFVNPEKNIQWALDYLESQLSPYEFSGLLYTMHFIPLVPGLQQYLDEQGFYMSLYYLGCSLYGEGYEQRAREIWTTLVRLPHGQNWSEKASMQLSQPDLSQEIPLF